MPRFNTYNTILSAIFNDYRIKGILLEQQDLNKRLILALVLSFFVFAGYAYLFPQQNETQAVDPTVKTQQTPGNAAPTASANNAAPTETASTPQASSVNAPVTTSNLTLLATVTSNTFKMSIDEFGRISQYELLEDKYKDEEGLNLQILGLNKVKPLEIRFSDAKLNDEAFKTPYVNSGESAVEL